jgi:hypothetical protein
MKEMIRKFLVSLKKNPQVIPLLAHTVAFGIYSLNLTVVSNTTAKIYGPHMGLCSFVTMLLSILAYVCMFSAYPKRKKPNWIMIAMILIMYAIIIFSDNFYSDRIWTAVKRPENPIAITESTQYILDAYNLMSTHIITTIISAVLIVTEPLYAKLLKKINTSIEIEDNGNLGAIELSDEE